MENDNIKAGNNFKKSDHSLLKDLQFTSTVLNTVDSLVLVLDKNGHIVLFNRSCEDATGYSFEEIKGKHVWDVLLLKEEIEPVKKVFHSLKAGMFPNRYKNYWVKKDGTPILISWSNSALLDKDGEVEYIVPTGLDITEKQRAEDNLQERERNYREIFNATNESIFLHDAEDGTILDVNQTMLEMYGYSYEEALNLKVSDLSLNEPPYTQQEAIRLVKKAVEEGPQVFDWQSIRKNGEKFWVEVALKSSSIGGHDRVLAVVRDVTEKRKMEDDLFKTQKMDSIGLLAGGIAHDFNNLLATILNNLFLIKIHTKSEEKILQQITAIEKASVKAQALTKQLLTFSKGGAPIKELTTIRELIEESISLSLRGSNVQCNVDVPDDLWHVVVDPGQMNQVFNNIIINADQAMPEGGNMSITCSNFNGIDDKTTPLKKGEYIRITIQDQGTGIPEEHLSCIFDPYFTLKESGSGLGLSTCYSIIKRHNGHIEVTSELGKGTEFIIYVPSTREKASSLQHSEDSLITGKGEILIMDDNAMVRESLGQMVECIGYNTQFAVDGSEALEIYEKAMTIKRPFKAVIMDLTIPGGMGGKETIRELRKIDPDVKAIVSSGYSNDPIMANFRDYGFKAVLSKPYKHIEELSMVLNRVIKDSGL